MWCDVMWCDAMRCNGMEWNGMSCMDMYNIGYWQMNHMKHQLVAKVPDDAPCVSPNLRTILMTAVSTWKRILGEGLHADWCWLVHLDRYPRLFDETVFRRTLSLAVEQRCFRSPWRCDLDLGFEQRSIRNKRFRVSKTHPRGECMKSAPHGTPYHLEPTWFLRSELLNATVNLFEPNLGQKKYGAWA